MGKTFRLTLLKKRESLALFNWKGPTKNGFLLALCGISLLCIALVCIFLPLEDVKTKSNHMCKRRAVVVTHRDTGPNRLHKASGPSQGRTLEGHFENKGQTQNARMLLTSRTLNILLGRKASPSSGWDGGVSPSAKWLWVFWGLSAAIRSGHIG